MVLVHSFLRSNFPFFYGIGEAKCGKANTIAFQRTPASKVQDSEFQGMDEVVGLG